MEILPAIDLKNGFAVRLKKGEINSAKIYSDKPWELAEKFADLGAKWLHIVDLDGAFAGEAKNAKHLNFYKILCVPHLLFRRQLLF